MTTQTNKAQNNQSNENKNQEAAEKAAAEAKAKADQEAAEKAAAEAKTTKKQPVNKATYDKYTALKFLSLSETKLTDKAKEEMLELEKELLACEGFKPKMTRRAAIHNEQVLLVEGIPLPDEYLKIIKSDKNKDFYLK